MTVSIPYRIDPDDPRAPPLDGWQQLSPAERARIIAELPSELDLGPPKATRTGCSSSARSKPWRHFERAGRSDYLSSELPIYYPGERMFAPDLVAVLDVEPHNARAGSSRTRGAGWILLSR